MPVSVARQIADSTNTEHCLQSITPVERREGLLRLYRRWNGMQPGSFGVSLLTASLAEEERRQRESIDLVWTGPDSRVIPVRQTEPVLLEMIHAAQKRLLVVSYAVYKMTAVRSALCEAIARGVAVRMVLDVMDPAEIDGYNPLFAVGGELLRRAEVLYWPRELRKPNSEGKRGLLHVKCVVADGRKLFLSSANLTEQAFRLNMELGILLSGTRYPAEVEEHFHELQTLGVLQRLKDPEST